MDIAVALVKLQWKWRTLLNAIARIANLYTSSSANLSSDMKRLALLSNARPTIPHNITFAKFHSPDEKLDSDSTLRTCVDGGTR